MISDSEEEGQLTGDGDWKDNCEGARDREGSKEETCQRDRAKWINLAVHFWQQAYQREIYFTFGARQKVYGGRSPPVHLKVACLRLFPPLHYWDVPRITLPLSDTTMSMLIAFSHSQIFSQASPLLSCSLLLESLLFHALPLAREAVVEYCQVLTGIPNLAIAISLVVENRVVCKQYLRRLVDLMAASVADYRKGYQQFC